MEVLFCTEYLMFLMCIVLIAHLVYYSLTTFNVYCINSTLSVLQSDYIVFDVLMCIVLPLIMFY
jgi:hypothetical protein